MRIRISIAGLMAIVLLLALGLAGLRAATQIWASAIFTCTLALLAASLVGATVAQGRFRAACLGFGIFGWSYFLAAFWFFPGPNGIAPPPFLTKALLEASPAHPPSQNPATSNVMVRDSNPTAESEDIPFVVTSAPGVIPATFSPFTGRVVNRMNVRRVGHMLATVVFGLLGVGVGAIFSGLKEEMNPGQPEPHQR